MKRNLIAAILLTAAVAFSCTTKEEKSASLIGDGSIVYNPTASIAGFVLDGPDTKTVLSIDAITGAKFTFEAGDVLGVYPYSPKQGDGVRFIYTESADASSFAFEGSGYGLRSDQSYAAYYPGVVANAAKEMMTQIPVDYTGQRQTSADGTTFDISDADYLVSNGITPANNACEFQMQHVGALLVMDVTFAEEGSYTELTLTSDTTPFTTTGTLDLTASEIAVETEGVAPSVTLALGEDGGNGLAVAAGETVRFCMMVAPVNLKSSTVTITLKDSENVEHTGRFKNGNFKAGYAYLLKASVTTEAIPVPEEPTDLGEIETANTYIVDVDNINPLGYYFTTTVAGNGVSMQEDIIDYFKANGANLWPQNGNPALIAGDAVDVLWNQNGCIEDVTYDATDRTIHFKATGKKGNAKVCININNINFWTWLIWCTDQPGTIEFTNETNNCTFTVMDRNIGATTGAGSSDIRAMDGVYYQWGNPIPYSTAEWAASSYTNSNNTMMNSLWYPETVHVPVQWAVQWFAPDGSHAKQLYGLLWGGGSLGAEQAGLDPKYHIRHGNTSEKTMYDPCPVGYKVAPYDFLNGYARVSTRTNASANVYGIVLAGDNGGEVLLPYNGMAWVGGNGLMSWAQGGVYDPVLDNAVYMYLWTAAYNNKNVPYALCASANNAAEINVTKGNLVVEDASGHGMGVRCVAE